MSKKKARGKQKQSRPERRGRGNRKVVIVAAVLLSLGLTGVIIAQLRAARVAGTTTAMLAAPAAPAPANFSPSNPSKEYIYAGGRLVATEEPTAATPSPTPPLISDPTPTPTPTTTPTPPPGGSQSLSLNGTDAYVQVDDTDNDLDLAGGPVTLEAWVKYNSIGTYQTILAKEDHGQATGGGGYELQITNTGQVRLNIWTSYNTYFAAIGASTITTGVWHHIATVVDGSQRRIYLDGQLEASVNGTQVPTASNSPFNIGRRPNNTYRFNGLIDEARVSQAALYTADFIPQVSLTSAASTTKGLWKFDGLSAANTTVTDSSGLGNYGQRNGGAAYSADVPQAARYSLSLNGTDSWVEVPYDAAVNTSLSLAGPFTVEAWVKFSSTGTYQTILAKEDHGQATGGGGYELQITNTGQARLNIWTSYNSYVAMIGATTLTPGVWYHIAAVADGSQRRMYVNGVLDASVMGVQLPTASNSPFNIGRRPNNTYRFNGLIDEARVSNAVLYTADFSLALTPDLFKKTSTVGLWRFNQQTADDTSGEANHGQPAGVAAFLTDVP